MIAIIVGLALALVGLIYSRRSEKKERAEAWEQEVRIKKKIEALLTEEARMEENRKNVEGLPALLEFLVWWNSRDRGP